MLFIKKFTFSFDLHSKYFIFLVSKPIPKNVGNKIFYFNLCAQ